MTSLAYHFASTDKDSWRRPSRTVYGLSERDTYTTIHGAFIFNFFIYIFSVTKFRTDKLTFSFFELFFLLSWLTRPLIFSIFFLFFSSFSLLFIFWHVKYFFYWYMLAICSISILTGKYYFFFFFFKALFKQNFAYLHFINFHFFIFFCNCCFSTIKSLWYFWLHPY